MKIKEMMDPKLQEKLKLCKPSKNVSSIITQEQACNENIKYIVSIKSVSSFRRHNDVVILSIRGIIVTPPGTIDAICGILQDQIAQSS